MKNTAIAVLAIAGLGLILSCGDAAKQKTGDKPAFDTVAARKAIDSLNRQFSALFIKNDSAGVADLYTQDAKFMDSGAPAVVGRTAIRSTMAGFMKAGITKVDFQTTGIYGCDSLVAEEGQLKLFIAQHQIADDKYIVLWKKEAGQWKIFRDISNTNTPPQVSK